MKPENKKGPDKRYWLVKQEPEAYSWLTFVKEGKAVWTGVRNFQARNNLRAMEIDDLVLFYHSVSEKQVVGIARVQKKAYPDPTAKEGDWSTVDLAPVRAVNRPVTLDEIKKHPLLKNILLIRNSRLSVSPLSKSEFDTILKLSETPSPQFPI